MRGRNGRGRSANGEGLEVIREKLAKTQEEMREKEDKLKEMEEVNQGHVREIISLKRKLNEAMAKNRNLLRDPESDPLIMELRNKLLRAQEENCRLVKERELLMKEMDRHKAELADQKLKFANVSKEVKMVTTDLDGARSLVKHRESQMLDLMSQIAAKDTEMSHLKEVQAKALVEGEENRKLIDRNKARIQELSRTVLDARRNELRLKQDLAECNEELEGTKKKLKQCAEEKDKLSDANEALEFELAEQKMKVEELQTKLDQAMMTHNQSYSSSPPPASHAPVVSTSPIATCLRSIVRSFIPHRHSSATTSPSQLPVPEIVKKVTTEEQAALTGCIRFAVPNFRALVAKREFDVRSDDISLAGFRWALRVKGHKNAGEPSMLGLWLCAKGPEGGQAQKQWDATAQMEFRVKRHYSADTAQQAKGGHIVRCSSPALFTNRTNPPRFLIGFHAMAELEMLSDPHNGFVFRNDDHLNVEVVFTVTRVKQTI